MGVDSKIGHVTLTTPLSWTVGCPKGNTWCSLQVREVWRLQPFRRYLKACKILKLVMWPWSRPFQGRFVTDRLGYAMINRPTKFEMPDFTRYGNMKGVVKCRKLGASCAPYTAKGHVGVSAGRGLLPAMAFGCYAEQNWKVYMLLLTIYCLDPIVLKRWTRCLKTRCLPRTFTTRFSLVLLTGLLCICQQ